jgi:rRNA maturation endonuclease Nob1
MPEFEKTDKGGTIRGLGCGRRPKPAGKIEKICVDCNAKVEVEADQMICPICGGPFSSGYDE